jgi:hypothetical protein
MAGRHSNDGERFEKSILTSSWSEEKLIGFLQDAFY